MPYFLVAHRDSAGPGPALLEGYGAFRVAQLPGYLGMLGRLLARGGSCALANIPGGGEFGPAWHEQAIRENRHKVAVDFAAVAQDLVAQGVTTVSAAGRDGWQCGGPT